MTKGEKKKVGCHPLDSGGFLVKVEDGTINLTHFFLFPELRIGGEEKYIG